MRLSIASLLLLAGVLAVPPSVGAQLADEQSLLDRYCPQDGIAISPYGNGRWVAVSQSFVGHGLIVSVDGKRFRYRLSWGLSQTKKKYTESQLVKIEKSGVKVVRLGKDAAEDDVDQALVKNAPVHIDHVECPRNYYPPIANGPWK